MVLVDFAFWDGTQAIAIDVGQGATGIAACRITPDVLTGDAQTLLAALPDGFRDFWRGDALPASPFRRPIPRGVLGESEHLSLRVDHRPAADPP
jgi:hypothetical protein